MGLGFGTPSSGRRQRAQSMGTAMWNLLRMLPTPQHQRAPGPALSSPAVVHAEHTRGPQEPLGKWGGAGRGAPGCILKCHTWRELLPSCHAAFQDA